MNPLNKKLSAPFVSITKRRLLGLVILACFSASGIWAQGTPAGDSGTDVNDINRIFDVEKDKTSKREVKSDYPNRGGTFQYVDPTKRAYKLDMLVAADLVGKWDQEKVPTTNRQFRPREVEIGFFASIDHLGEGTLMAAAHNENGEVFFELHEAFFQFNRTFIPNTSIKLGHFFYDVGRLNGIHRHDWSFTQAPVVHEELLDEEAVSDAGIEFKILMPWDFWQELVIGVFNGSFFGHTHSEGLTKANPLYTLHLKQFFPFWKTWGTQFGFSYLRWHPTENKRRVTHQSGIDLLVKWKKGKLRSFQWLSEVWYRETRQTRRDILENPAPPVETRVGAYTFLEYQFHKEWYAGVRFDYFTDPNFRGTFGYTIPNGTEAQSFMITWRPSEFAYYRVTLENKVDLSEDTNPIADFILNSRTQQSIVSNLLQKKNGKSTLQLYFQADFILGMHPPHVY